jgi:hypothetical protein
MHHLLSTFTSPKITAMTVHTGKLTVHTGKLTVPTRKVTVHTGKGDKPRHSLKTSIIRSRCTAPKKAAPKTKFDDQVGVKFDHYKGRFSHLFKP